MQLTPRVALVVHNRFESDPRVSRHARAALRAGYRVAILSVTSPTDDCGASSPRWGERSGGALVFESKVLGRSLLGRLRSMAGALSRSGRSSQGTTSGEMPAGMPTEAEVHAGPRSSLLDVGRDVAQIALMVRNNVGLFRQFRGVGAALVHANDLNVLPASYLLARYWRAPLVYDSHELWTELDAAWSPLLRRLFALLEGALIGRAEAVVTVNSAIAKELALRYRGVQPVVVMNCAELTTASAAWDGAAEPAGGVWAACTGDDRLPVIYQGMLHRHSGIMGVIDAAVQVPEVSLSIRGPGDLRGQVREYLETRRLDRQVRLLDPVPMRDLVPALRGYAVGIVPYLPVGLNYRLSSPNKLFEYMAAGLAVVCSDLPVLREVVQEAECGLLYEPGDVQSLAQALRTLARDPELVGRFRANALAAVRRRYNAGHEEGRLMDIYARLLALRSPVQPPQNARITPSAVQG